jgi:uncharacterized protein YjaG (DUF416 family)
MNRLKFQKSLNALNGWRERAFIAALAERAFPNVRLYLSSIDKHATEFNDSYFDSVWQALIFDQDEDAIVELLDIALANLPDLENNEHYGALPTHDCLSILEQALLGGINDEKPRALAASQLSLETITQFIEFSEGESLSENQLVKLFDSHPLIEREFSFQAEISELLRSASHPADELIFRVREIAQDEGVSNIGISL